MVNKNNAQVTSRRDANLGKRLVSAAFAVLLLSGCTLLYTEQSDAEPVSPPESPAVATEPDGDATLWAKVGASVVALLGGTGAAWKWKRGKG